MHTYLSLPQEQSHYIIFFSSPMPSPASFSRYESIRLGQTIYFYSKVSGKAIDGSEGEKNPNGKFSFFLPLKRD